jgi:acetyl-CoA synthetase
LGKTYPVSDEFARSALIKAADYDRMYRESVEDPDAFWRHEAQRLDWIEPFTQVKDTSFHEADFRIRWFADGQLNVSANCLDRHLAERGEERAIIWEGDNPGRKPHGHLPRASRGSLPAC